MIITVDESEWDAMEKRIKELEDGSCRFNCRTVKEGFYAGWDAQVYKWCKTGKVGGHCLEAYKEWRKESGD